MRLPVSLLVFLFLSFTGKAQSPTIIPQPVSVKQPNPTGHFTLSGATQLILEGSNLEKTAAYLNDYLYRFYSFKLKIVKKATGSNVVRLNYERLDKPVAGAYTLTVDGKGIYIAGDNEEGVFYGIQTLIQLLPVPAKELKSTPGRPVPYVAIEDAPRFAYRGMHLDVGRHFFPVSFVKKYIDYLALHKLNYFHWHLTEDQGWRIEIKKYPRLTSTAAYRNGTIIGRFPGKGNDGKRYGGFYTQAEIREVVKYAADRYITIIPEIEMPGHSSAAIAAYPELSCFPSESTRHPAQCAWSGDTSGKQVQQTWGVFDDVYCAGKENTFTFLQNVLDEVLPLFPSSYVHIGGDESPKANWRRCPLCQQRIKDNHLKDEHELQSYFIQRMEKYLNSKGKTLIGWDEILEGGLAPKAVVMSWRGEKGGIDAAKQKHYVIMTPGNPVYFDHSQSKNEDSVTIGGYIPLEKVYAYEPVPKELNEEETKYVLGAQANLWSEYMQNARKVEYMIFPRMSALSEVLWSPKEKRNWNDFEKRLGEQFRRYDLWKANYSKAIYDLNGSVLPTDDYSGIRWSVSNKYPASATDFYENVKLATPDTIAIKDKPSKNKIARYTVATTSPKPLNNQSANNPEEIIIRKPGIFKVEVYRMHQQSNSELLLPDRQLPPMTLQQEFHFNKATGKNITLMNPPAGKYPGDGAFTLVNGVQNEKGLARTTEFLGFEGGDCEAIIDLGKIDTVNTLTVYFFTQPSSWIYPPKAIEIISSVNDSVYYPLASAVYPYTSTGNGRSYSLNLRPNPQVSKARFIRIKISNAGLVPEGNPGAGNKAWLFVDEIEIN